MKEFLIIGGLIYLFAENFSVEIKTNSDSINQSLSLPAQIPISDIIFNKRKNNPSNFFQAYLAINDKTKYLN